MHGRSLSDVGDWERGQGHKIARGKFQDGMRALRTTGENCTEITRGLRWTIQISSGYLWDLAWLEDRSVKFLEGSSSGSRGPWQQKLHNSWRALVVGFRSLGNKNYAIPGGSWQ